MLTYLSTNIEGSSGKVNVIKFLQKNAKEMVMVSLKMAKIMFVGAIMVKFSKLACKRTEYSSKSGNGLNAIRTIFVALMSPVLMS